MGPAFVRADESRPDGLAFVRWEERRFPLDQNAYIRRPIKNNRRVLTTMPFHQINFDAAEIRGFRRAPHRNPRPHIGDELLLAMNTTTCRRLASWFQPGGWRLAVTPWRASSTASARTSALMAGLVAA